MGDIWVTWRLSCGHSIINSCQHAFIAESQPLEMNPLIIPCLKPLDLNWLYPQELFVEAAMTI
jgi:hypothetical protein